MVTFTFFPIICCYVLCMKSYHSVFERCLFPIVIAVFMRIAIRITTITTTTSTAALL